MNKLFSDLNAHWQRIYISASGRHAQLYYRKAIESYDIATDQWKNFELVAEDDKNLSLAAAYFLSTENKEIARQVAHVELAVRQRHLLELLAEIQQRSMQSLAIAEEALSGIEEQRERIANLQSRIDETMAWVRSIAGTTEPPDHERKE